MKITEIVKEQQLAEPAFLAPLALGALRMAGGAALRGLGIGARAATKAVPRIGGVGGSAARVGANTAATTARQPVGTKLKQMAKKKAKNYVRNKLSLGGDDAGEQDKDQQDAINTLSQELEKSGKNSADLEQKVANLEKELGMMKQKNPAIAQLVQQLAGTP